MNSYFPPKGYSVNRTKNIFLLLFETPVEISQINKTNRFLM